MKTRLTVLSVIAFAALATSARAQIISADFTETLNLGGDTNEIVATGQLTPYTLSESPLSSGAIVTNPDNLQGSVNLTLSSSGLITLQDVSDGTQYYNSITFTLTNIQFTDAGDAIIGIKDLTTGAIQADGSTDLVFSQPITSNSASLLYSGSGGSGLLTINGDDPQTDGDTPSTFQLTIVPEPRDWAMIVLLGIGGLVAVRKLRERFPALAFIG